MGVELGYRARMLDRQNGLIALFLALLSASCGDDGGSADAEAAEDGGLDAGDASGETDAGSGPDGDADQDGAVDEVDPTVLTNFSFDDAKPIELGPTGALQPLQSATQVDYFSFEAEAGVFYVITGLCFCFSIKNLFSF